MSDMQTTPVNPSAYPATFEVDYPDRNLNRLTSFFRIFTAIPILIISGLLIGSIFGSGDRNDEWLRPAVAGGFIFLPLVLMILFRQKYPKWWFDWNLNFSRFSYRVAAYLLLLRDEYPSTDEEQAVHLDMIYPDVPRQLGRGMPLIKWFLAIPHWIILFFLVIAEIVVLIMAWFAILFTGRYPQSFFDFTVGVMRWGFRVQAYAIVLVTDQYPPFSIST
jgi:hypothetical protein